MESGFFAKRPAIVYVTDNICLAAWNSSDTSAGLWAGMQGICEPNDCDLLAVIGDKRLSGYISVSHDLISDDSADGFLAWRSRFGADCETYFQRFQRKPLIFLSTAHGPQPVVAIPNREGILGLIQHLVDVHGFRRIAYIGGPAGHRYAQERLAAYQEAMQSNSIAIDPRWITPPGAWAMVTGEFGVTALFSERGLRPGLDVEAIVCASDQLALGAMAELARRNIDVPSQIAVTGFNNIREARTHFPALTTASMPFPQQGRQALRQLLGEMGRIDLPGLDPELIPRLVVGETCGCGNQRLLQLHTGKMPAAHPAVVPEATDLRSWLAQYLHQMMTLPEANALADQLIDTVYAVIRGADINMALHLILPQIRTGYFGLLDQIFWQQAFGLFRHGLQSQGLSAVQLTLAEEILESLRETVAEHYSREQGALTVWENKVFDLLRLISADLALAENLPAMMNRLATDFPQLGIHSCWLVVYNTLPQSERAPDGAHLILAIEQCRRYELPAAGVPFLARHLVPSGYRQVDEPGVFALFPIMHGEYEYGYVIFNQSASTNYYETLANSIGAAMRHLRLREELASRTHQLERSYQDLVGAQKRLLEADKMAALGELVAGVAHEINTPVGVGVTAISTLIDETRTLADLVRRRQAGPIPGVVHNLQESAAIAMRNLERASQLIESFKLIAVDQSRAEIRTFCLENYLHDVVRSVAPRLRPGGHQVDIVCPLDIEITCDPSIIARIMTNLLINSLLHGFEYQRNGQIRVVCERNVQGIQIEYRDNGAGMAPEVLEKMFNPFFTTKRGRGGTGLGMHIVYNLVTKALNGTIQCESLLGHGACFRITIPV